MTILHVSREYRGLGEAGGVKDVVHDLALTLSRLGHHVRVFTPFYGYLKTSLMDEVIPVWKKSIDNWDIVIYKTQREGIEVFLVETPWLSEFESVYSYTRSESDRGLGNEGQGYPTELQRNLSFQRAVIDSCSELAANTDVLHAHDAHTALIGGAVTIPRKVLTLHNAGYPYQQNISDKDTLLYFFPELEPHWNQYLLGEVWSPLLYAFAHSQVLTVSPYYAQEIMSENGNGETGPLAPELQKRGITLRGFFNGYDFSTIDPRQDKELGGIWSDWSQEFETLFHYKSRAKSVFNQTIRNFEFEGQIPDSNKTWLVFHARLTRQKGIEEILELITEDPLSDATYVLMGQGEKHYREALKGLALTRSNVCYFPFYQEKLLLRLLAAADFFLIPSVFEPCALTDLMALYYGALPIVRKTGGLKKIRHLVEGIVYEPPQTLVDAASLAFILKNNNPDLVLRMAKQGLVRTHDFNVVEVVQRVWLPIYSGLEPDNKFC